MKKLSTSLGLLIRSTRKKNGLTQEQLAGKSGMKTPDISAIENGKRSLTTPLIERIATALEMEVDIVFKMKE